MSASPLPADAWVPDPEWIRTTNAAWLMRQAGVETWEELHAWSVREREAYWRLAIKRLGIRFAHAPERIADFSGGAEAARWLPGARLNIVESCLQAAPEAPAIVYQAEGGAVRTMTTAELRELTARVAENLRRLGLRAGEAIAVMMPMTAACVAIYLGIIQAGCVVVGIADSFRPKEIATRLRLAKAVAIFTGDVTVRGGKRLPLYPQVLEAGAPQAIVLPAEEQPAFPLREGDWTWADFLSGPAEPEMTPGEPTDAINILFSSGTTGEPKAIPWTQTTPLKCAADAHFHQEVRPGDVLVWPTNIGWMMGPWLIFAALLNRAALGLYEGTPTGREFGRFVQDSRATLLGVVPSLVKTWRASRCMEEWDWSGLRLFSSTGECSTAEEMRWLMARAGGRPVIEYCGGTEIGGGYLTGTPVRPCVPGLFNTLALGLDVAILDEEGQAAEQGELFLVPPSIGLSERLLNQDHHAVYFAEAPRGLRRHGDRMEALPGGYWRGHGRADDTMNLGGIKVSSAEIERAVQTVPGIAESAAIGVSPGGGASRLVIYAVGAGASRPEVAELQNAIRRELNPLFKIHELVFVEALPRTASNKVMRRVLRDAYADRSA